MYNRFILKYPTAGELSDAPVEELRNDLRCVGLYSQKSINLANLGKKLIELHGGNVPDKLDMLLELPGIGPYVGNAVLCFAYNRRVPLLDTNIGRILDRVFSINVSGEKRKRLETWNVVASFVPASKSKEYNYSLVDFGALVCSAKNPDHESCPLRDICNYYNENK